MIWRNQPANCVAKAITHQEIAPHTAASVKGVSTLTQSKMFAAHALLGKSPRWDCRKTLAFSARQAKPQTTTTLSATHVSSGAMVPHTSLVMIAPSGSIKTTRGRLSAKTAASIDMVWPCLTKTDSSALLCQTLSVSLARQIQTKPPEELQALTPKTHACVQRRYSTK